MHAFLDFYTCCTILAVTSYFITDRASRIFPALVRFTAIFLFLYCSFSIFSRYKLGLSHQVEQAHEMCRPILHVISHAKYLIQSSAHPNTWWLSSEERLLYIILFIVIPRLASIAAALCVIQCMKTSNTD